MQSGIKLNILNNSKIIIQNLNKIEKTEILKSILGIDKNK